MRSPANTTRHKVTSAAYIPTIVYPTKTLVQHVPAMLNSKPGDLFFRPRHIARVSLAALMPHHLSTKYRRPIPIRLFPLNRLQTLDLSTERESAESSAIARHGCAHRSRCASRHRFSLAISFTRNPNNLGSYISAFIAAPAVLSVPPPICACGAAPAAVKAGFCAVASARGKPGPSGEGCDGWAVLGAPPCPCMLPLLAPPT